MPTALRSYAKINLGLAIGPPRPDGFHSLRTLYQTINLYDVLTVSARWAGETRVRLTSNDPRVPLDSRNTVCKMIQAALEVLGRTAEVAVHIQKNLPIQGGMGAGSANAAAALLGFERELRLQLPEATRLKIAERVGSDVPLFLLGGSVLGTDRGQLVRAVADVTLAASASIPCVIALPPRGVSTPQAFRDWDKRFNLDNNPDADLHNQPIHDTIEELSRTYASVFGNEATDQHKSGASGIFPELSPVEAKQDSPEKLQRHSGEQLHTPLSSESQGKSGLEDDLAENSLLALVHTGIENDFEQVVFLQYPLLGEIKRHLMGTSEADSAVYAALSGSGSALFGLYRSQADANAAQQRLQQHGVQALVTTTLPRPLYWSEMFAE